MWAIKALVVLCAILVTVSSEGLLETLLSWELPVAEGRSSSKPQSKCLCQPSGCLCCVDLNLTTTIDLGGPACLNIKYKEENVSLNLSYGDNEVHNATIKLVNAANKPTCMNLLADLAQICARFTSVEQAASGNDGCLVIEPALLGAAQATYPIGCFKFHQAAVQQIESAVIQEAADATAAPDEEEEVLNTDELIAAVSASAEQGIAMFSQWLGLNLNPKLNLTGENSGQESHSASRAAESSGARSGRQLAQVQQEKSDERFKQLLSAQDNILKESAKIGVPGAGQTYFVYSDPVETLTSSAPRTQEQAQGRVQEQDALGIVPRESRRGGRAYNIRQHVNEV
ncbi:uncharacterized protein LOC107267121 [Cephus cinctus]|uniref:Uncharacterized protein LOC107267121 n=1 Tax=Cephus cinctus TaxID=211228 RepID=A0AAJ7BTK4_CEPCN|nr:uncharacterized protein LOC107267121 [Cephus cinctus]